jgi:hypothetical protein
MDLAAQLASGTLPHAAFAVLRILEDEPLPPAERLQIADEVVRTANLPAAHYGRMRALIELGRTQEALAAGREGLALSSEPDLRSRLAVGMLHGTADGEDRVELLRIAADPRGNLVAAAQARWMVRSPAPWLASYVRTAQLE